MTTDLIKIAVPILMLAYWLFGALRSRSYYLSLITLFFVSTAVFSANFTLFYRELHQLIQVVIIIFFLMIQVRLGYLNRTILYMLVFMAMIVSSLIFSVLDEDARIQFFNFVSIFGVVGFFSVVMGNGRHLMPAMGFFSKICIILAVVGLVEFALNPGTRVETTFSNPNYYAFFMGLGFCAISYASYSRYRYLYKALIVMAILLSQSRAGLIFPALQVAWDLYRHRNLRLMLAYGTVGMVLLGVLMLTSTLPSRDSDATSSSDAERIIFSRIALQMAKDHPWTGVGWGRYPAEFSSYSVLSDSIMVGDTEVSAANQDRRVTHSDPLRIVAELGWPAMIVCTLFTIYLFWRIFAFRRFDPGLFMPSWTGVVLFSLSHNNLNAALFWIFYFLPLIYGLLRPDQEKEDELHGSRSSLGGDRVGMPAKRGSSGFS